MKFRDVFDDVSVVFGADKAWRGASLSVGEGPLRGANPGSQPNLTIDRARELVAAVTARRALSVHNLAKGANLLLESVSEDRVRDLSDAGLVEYVLAVKEISIAAQYLRLASCQVKGAKLDYVPIERCTVDILNELLARSKSLPRDSGFRAILQDCFDLLFGFVQSSDSPELHQAFWLSAARSGSYLARKCKGEAVLYLFRFGSMAAFHRGLNSMLSDRRVRKARVYGLVSDLVAKGISPFDLATAFHALSPLAYARLHVALRRNIASSTISPQTTRIKRISSQALSCLSKIAVH